jgi:hypothetical protein
MSKPSWVDSKLIIWILGMIGLGVGAFYRLEALGETMGRVENAVDAQSPSL